MRRRPPGRLRADQRWRIDGRGPSPRAVVGLIRRWWREWSAWLLGAYDGPEGEAPTPSDIQTAATRLTVGGDEPPFPADRYQAAAVPAATTAGRAARGALVRAGMPRDVLDARVGRVVTSQFAVDLEGLDLLGAVEREALVEWSQDGIDLIRAVPRELLDDLPTQIADALTRGERWETLRETIRGRLGVSERHLNLIARDQVAKLNSRVTRAMHERAGVTEYIWRATFDGRTRQSHLDAHGTRVRWDSPGVPGTGFYGTPSHAGQGGQCRCTAEPVVEGFD